MWDTQKLSRTSLAPQKKNFPSNVLHYNRVQDPRAAYQKDLSDPFHRQQLQELLSSGYWFQVTTIPVTFYNKQLSDQPVQALEDLLQVEGAAGHTIPYLGYIQTTVEFPKDFVGCTISVPTLALIVPDVRPGFPTSILIGMNTLETL